MKPMRIFMLLGILVFAEIALTATALGQGTGAKTSTTASAAPAQQADLPTTIAGMVDREISDVEKQVVEAAEAMPEGKFNFSPENLNIPGDDYKGVRTFAVQVKHIATSNYFLWSTLTGDKVPDNLKDGNGPADMKSKADIIKFLKDSFALGHKAAATLTTENMLQPVGNGKWQRLHRAEFGVAHAFNHYGQMGWPTRFIEISAGNSYVELGNFFHY